MAERTLPDLERVLIAANLLGALVFGWRHQPDWLFVPALAFGAYVVIADRRLRRQIGPRAWPSAGYARFALNTNLYFAFKHLLVGGLVFLAAGMLRRTLFGG
jgi:hypothetical protein